MPSPIKVSTPPIGDLLRAYRSTRPHRVFQDISEPSANT